MLWKHILGMLTARVQRTNGVTPPSLHPCNRAAVRTQESILYRGRSLPSREAESPGSRPANADRAPADGDSDHGAGEWAQTARVGFNE